MGSSVRSCGAVCARVQHCVLASSGVPSLFAADLCAAVGVCAKDQLQMFVCQGQQQQHAVPREAVLARIPKTWTVKVVHVAYTRGTGGQQLPRTMRSEILC